MRVPDQVRDCCCFIYENIGGKHHICGTGFLIGEPFVADGDKEGTEYQRHTERGIEFLQYTYLVTAKHIIDEIKKNSSVPSIGMRLNVRNGDTADIDIPINAWLYHPTDPSVDAAILPMPEIVGIDIMSLPFHKITMNNEVIRKYGIGIGDEVCIIGLFYKYYGTKKNVPILRTGNIAMMPHEKIRSTRFGDIDAYLIELRSIGGLSGSPVFVHKQYAVEKGTSDILFWMGLMHGHWEVGIDSIDVLDNLDNQQLNTGIGIVVPAYKVLEITRQDAITKAKEKHSKKRWSFQ